MFPVKNIAFQNKTKQTKTKTSNLVNNIDKNVDFQNAFGLYQYNQSTNTLTLSNFISIKK